MATEIKHGPGPAVHQAPNGANGHMAPIAYLPHAEVNVGTGARSAKVIPPSRGDAGLDHATLRAMYENALMARALDERMWQVNRAGRAPFVISGQGHEGAQTGAAFALDRTKDYLLPYYRDLAICLAFGVTPDEIMINLMAKEGDTQSGARQMPGHYGSAEHRIITGSSPVATQLPHAVGVAYAAKLKHEGAVAFVSFGEGGSSKGDFHESCNFAGIHNLPVIFFCENNYYAISVPQQLQMSVDNVADRAAAYDFPGIIVDGTDTLAVYQAVKEAADRARHGDGPTLIEAKLYRFTPHSSDDDDRTYRDQTEVKAWREHDPIALFEQRLREIGVLDDGSIKEIRDSIRRQVTDATERAEAAPFPDPATFDRYVYAEQD